MTWYLGQFWWITALAFLLGVLVGWWWWRRQWTKVRFTESEAISQVTTRHSEHLAEKDAEIARLRRLLGTPDAPAAAVAAGDTARGVAAPVHTAAPVHSAATVDAAVPDVAPPVEAAVPDAAVPDPAVVATPALVDLEGVDTPSVDLTGAGATGPAAIDLTGVDVPSVDLNRDAAASPQVPTQGSSTEGLAVPAAGAEPAGSPVEALAGEQGMIDLAQGETAADAEDTGHDLERIEGIGPRIAGALRASGIHTFGALADSDVASLQAALEAAGLRFAPSLPTWARQARLLADGDEAGFLALTEQLVAGRDPGRRP